MKILSSFSIGAMLLPLLVSAAIIPPNSFLTERDVVHVMTGDKVFDNNKRAGDKIFDNNKRTGDKIFDNNKRTGDKVFDNN